MARRRILYYTAFEKPATGKPYVVAVYSNGTTREWVKGELGYAQARRRAKEKRRS